MATALLTIGKQQKSCVQNHRVVYQSQQIKCVMIHVAHWSSGSSEWDLRGNRDAIAAKRPLRQKRLAPPTTCESDRSTTMAIEERPHQEIRDIGTRIR